MLDARCSMLRLNDMGLVSDSLVVRIRSASAGCQRSSSPMAPGNAMSMRIAPVATIMLLQRGGYPRLGRIRGRDVGCGDGRG